MELAELRKIDPFEFEEYIATIYEGWGYKCRVTKQHGDYGADIIAKNKDEKLAIQVKRYARHHKVKVEDVYPVHSAKDFYNCDRAVLVATSDLTHKASLLARSLGIEIITSKELEAIITDYDLAKAKIETENKISFTTTEKLAVSLWFIIFIMSIYVF